MSNDGAAATGQSGLTQSVLLVEDEIFIRMEIAERLRSAGFKVIEGGNGHEALARLRSDNRVNLILTDLRMPGMDGSALVRQLRVEFPQMRVFMTSGQLPSQAVFQMLDDFFPKPFVVADFTSYLAAGCRLHNVH